MELVKFWEYDKESRTPFLVLGAHSLLGEQTGKRQFQPPSFSSYVGETFLLLVILCFWLLQQGVCLLPQQPPKCCLFSSFFWMPFAPGYWLWGLLRFLLKHLPSSLCSLLLDNTIYSLGWEDPLKQEMAIHSSILAWRIHGQRRLVGYKAMGLQRVEHDWAHTRQYHK